MASVKNGVTTEEAIEAINPSLKDETWRYKKFFKNRQALLAKDGFHIILAAVDRCLCGSLDHLTFDSKASIFG